MTVTSSAAKSATTPNPTEADRGAAAPRGNARNAGLNSADVTRLASLAAQAMQERKAINLKILDLTAVCDFTDYFLVCTASNERQAQAIADGVLDVLKPLKVRPLSVEGYNRAHWVLLDFGDFLVHIFDPEKRDLYALERLWGDAPDVTQKLAPEDS